VIGHAAGAAAVPAAVAVPAAGLVAEGAAASAGANYGASDVADAAAGAGANYGANDIADAAAGAGASYGASDIADAAAGAGASYGASAAAGAAAGGEAGALAADAVEIAAALAGLAPALDAGAGLERAGGSAAAYSALLRGFCAAFAGHEKAIMQSLAAGDWNAWSIRLHGMKGLFAAMGADGLCARAAALEKALKGGGFGACKAETPGFCLAIRSLGEALLASPLAPPPKAPRARAEPAALIEKLAELKAACLQGDTAAADALSALLAGMTLGGEGGGDAPKDEASRRGNAALGGEAESESPAAPGGGAAGRAELLHGDDALDEICALADSLDYAEAAEKIGAFLLRIGAE